LVTALVVLPTASSASVDLRTSLGRPAISAMPPALSVTGPEGVERHDHAGDASMAVTAIAMPKRPASDRPR
jgi:hypothetical protein